MKFTQNLGEKSSLPVLGEGRREALNSLDPLWGMESFVGRLLSPAQP